MMIINWHNEEFLKQSILQKILHAVNSGRSISIVGNQSEMSREIKELCTFLSGLSPKMKVRDKGAIEWSRKLVELEMIQQKLLDASQKIKSPVFGEVNILELAEITSNAIDKKSNKLLAGLLDNRLFKFNKQEFWGIRGKLVKAMELFSEELIFMDIHSPLNDSIYVVQEENGRAVVNKYLDNFIGKSQLLISEYAHFFSAFKDDLLQQRNSKLDYINESVFSYSKVYSRFGILPPETEFAALDKAIEKWLNVDGFCMDFIKDSALTDNLYQSIRVAKNNGQLFVDKKRKTINVRNYSNDVLRDLESRFERFLKELNGSEILTDRIENNAISSWLKFKQLQHVHSVLASTKSLLQQGNPYFQWKMFLEDCDMQMQHILSQLIKFPKIDWLPMVEAWYLGETLHGLQFHKQSIMEAEIQKCCEIDQEQYSDIQSVFSVLVRQAKTLDSSKIEYIDINDVNTFIENRTDTENQEVIFMPIGHENLSPYLTTYLAANDTHVFADKASKNYEESFGLRNEFVASSLVHADLNNKLHWSKALANALQKYTRSLKFLFTPTKNIITHSHSFVLDEIIQIIQDGSIKQIQISEKKEQHITEYFLNDSEQAFFIYDQSIFQFSTKDEIIEFGALIRALGSAGYHTIYLDNSQFNSLEYIEELKKNTAKIISYA